MAPVALKRLVASQAARSKEIELMLKRLKEKPRDALSKLVIQARIDSLKATWSEVRTTHAEIASREEAEEDPYVKDDVYGRLQSLYEDALDESLTMMEGIVGTSTPIPRAVDGNESESRVAKLPKLELPKFSGEYEQWQSFCDLFTSLVDNAEKISDATKLHYLKSCLTGSAQSFVKDVATTNANYASTWAALKARYNNPRLIVNNLLNALMNLPYLKRESAADLRALIDKCLCTVRALKNLQMPVDNWDVWLIHVLAARLDSESRRAWESELSKRQETDVDIAAGNNALNVFPKFSEFIDFLERRARTLSVLNPVVVNEKVASKKQISAVKAFHTQQNDSSAVASCLHCEGPHALYKCFKFQRASLADRRKVVRRFKLCYNCFGTHAVAECSSKGRCNRCGGKHHSLIHFDQKGVSASGDNAKANEAGTSDAKTNTDNKSVAKPASQANTFTTQIAVPQKSVLLATAKVCVLGPQGNFTYVRALLDQASEVSFVSRAVVQLLKLPTEATQTVINGVNDSKAGVARSCTRLKLRSLVEPSFEIEVDALVMPRLTSSLPKRSLFDIDLKKLIGLKLADPRFYVSDKIDVILGADVYGRLLKSGLKSIVDTNLVAQNTVLGWIVSGPVASVASRRAETSTDSICIMHCVTNEQLSESLQLFWKLEEFPEAPNTLKPEEEACEQQFRESHKVNVNGRYVVRLPVKTGLPSVGEETRKIALSSLAHVHRRFERDPNWANEYREFMASYERLGHMTRVPMGELVRDRVWYLPHHAVVTSKMRVVFDAARKTRENYSLNEYLSPGPALQRDLSLILFNWRRYKFAFTADIIKMFRQIGVAPEDQDIQRIVWSPSRAEKPVDYRLTTVTYGTACAPYLAIRTLLQIAQDNREHYPFGSQCLENNVYVDDVFSGSNELVEAVEIRRQLVECLRKAGIELSKWAANNSELLPDTRTMETSRTEHLISSESIQTLGIRWDPSQDTFQFNALNLKEMKKASSKRMVLSSIARLFDPLGWVGPVTIAGKVLMQDLWIAKCGWDEELPTSIREQWLQYCCSLERLPEISVPRWLGLLTMPTCQLHGFSDASSRAYGAVVYIRFPKENGSYDTVLLASKTKVAPVKTISIPNLELCGAVLLVRLIQHLRQADFLKILSVYAWTDSQIVLTWLRKHPRMWRVFVANRVSYIQTELPAARWGHVATKENPADLASRGSEAGALKDCYLWWHGPSWLSKEEKEWPAPSNTVQVMHAVAPLAEPKLLRRFSSLDKLIRVVAYMRRWLLWHRARKDQSILSPFLTTGELNDAQNVTIKLAQSYAFASEISLLMSGKELPKRNALRKLAPYVDLKTGILHVRGRLAHSSLPDKFKHPPILPRKSVLSKLFIARAHRICLHGGPTLTIATVMRSVWILGVTQLAKSHVRYCVVCQRSKPRLAHQLMGDLPATRVTPGRPFSTSGLDYAGPIQVRTTKGRGHRSYKGYIVLFVCFATRAIHLELVSDLTTASFIAAFRRFIGRRGKCVKLFSDNATTFHGADTEMRAMLATASAFYTEVASTLAKDGTSWTFIPPGAPHYGGIWEAGVKSTKHHLKRVIGEHTLTFEELSTLLVEIEACLNSRPLCPMTSDVNDLEVLTPAHFLIGEASMLIPDVEPPTVPENRLTRFQLLQRLRNLFWQRWSGEYLHHLQERSKWRDVVDNFTIGTLVLIKDERYPPSKWPLGRVIAVHAGPDGLIRVVSVKTATNTLRQHVAKLCPLHISENQPKEN